MKFCILTTAAAIFLMQISASAADKVLASFATKDAVKAWNSVNDGVMGGVSTGGASWTEQGTLLFSGELSLANNGGFASIRTEPRSLGLAGSSAIVVKARGDGRTYSIELRVAGQTGASSYRADLPTPDFGKRFRHRFSANGVTDNRTGVTAVVHPGVGSDQRPPEREARAKANLSIVRHPKGKPSLRDHQFSGPDGS
jgi:hypothetical protein